MQVILLERIAKLGQMGDIVRVKDGYARNYLLPQGKALRANAESKKRFEKEKAQLQSEYARDVAGGMKKEEAAKERDRRLAAVSQRYERELMNPKEALSLGSISQLVMPYDLRQSLATNLNFLLRHYKPEPMGGVQREFH